jgi:hypothetical protein
MRLIQALGSSAQKSGKLRTILTMEALRGLRVWPKALPSAHCAYGRTTFVIGFAEAFTLDSDCLYLGSLT